MLFNVFFFYYYLLIKVQQDPNKQLFCEITYKSNQFELKNNTEPSKDQQGKQQQQNTYNYRKSNRNQKTKPNKVNQSQSIGMCPEDKLL